MHEQSGASPRRGARTPPTLLIGLIIGVVAITAGLLASGTSDTVPNGDDGAAKVSSEVSAPGISGASASALPTMPPPAVAAGKELFARTCAGCHGVEGVGERPDDPAAVDATGLPLAPPLNASGHAWHHSDEGLAATILQGSPRNPRMIAWGQAGLTEEDARNIVTYMKSMWGVVERTCQGALHMDRNCIETAQRTVN